MTTTMNKTRTKKLLIPDKYLARRGIVKDICVRNINENERSAEFVAATENGVETYDGPEYLDMDGVNLERYLSNPLLLDAHQREKTADVIGGNTEISIEKRKIIAKPHFATHSNADDIYNLVIDGFVRMLSIGYIITKREVIEEGATAKLGRKSIKGPAVIGREWMLLEISTVPIGADPDALKRSMNELNLTEARQLRQKLDSYIYEKEENMSNFEKELMRGIADEDEAQQDGDADLQDADDTEAGADDTAAVDQGAAPEDDASAGDNTAEAGSDDGQSTEGAEAPEETDRQKAIYAITPRGLEKVAAQCVIDNLTVDQAKKRLHKALEDSMKPVGTPDSADIDAQRAADAKAKDEKNRDQASEDVLDRSLF